MFFCKLSRSYVYEKPILTSDLSFATTVCGDAALYFNPMDPNDIANKIRELITNQSLYNNLVNRGAVRLDSFETPQKELKNIWKYVLLFPEVKYKLLLIVFIRIIG